MCITAKQQHGPSEYAMRRQANIEENHHLLASLSLSGGGSSTLDKLLLKGRKKKGENKGYGFLLVYMAFTTITFLQFANSR